MDFSTVGYVGMRSPNRADVLVWALTDLLIDQAKGMNVYEFYREQAAELAAPKAAECKISYAPGSVEWEAAQRGDAKL